MTDKLIDLLTEFDEKGYAPTTFCLNPEEAATNWKKRLAAAIENELTSKTRQLEEENAALRERLDKAVELPEYVFGCIDGKVEKIAAEYLTLGELKNLRANGYVETPEAAEKRLKELGGEK